MKVAILGSGAMGTVLGAYLTKNGCQVELIDNYQAHVDKMNSCGAHIVGTVDFTVPVKAILTEQMEGIYDVVFLFTKQLANDQVPSVPCRTVFPSLMSPRMWARRERLAALCCGAPRSWSPACPS